MRLVSKIHQLLQTSCGRMRDYRPNLKDQDEIHAGFRYIGQDELNRRWCFDDLEGLTWPRRRKYLVTEAA